MKWKFKSHTSVILSNDDEILLKREQTEIKSKVIYFDYFTQQYSKLWRLKTFLVNFLNLQERFLGWG